MLQDRKQIQSTKRKKHQFSNMPTDFQLAKTLYHRSLIINPIINPILYNIKTIY